MVAESYELLASIDAIDAAVNRRLEKSRNGHGFIEFTRRSVGNGRIVYNLTNNELGDIGEIELTVISPSASWLHFSHVKDPGTRNHTREELEMLRSVDDREKKTNIILEIDNARKNERRKLCEKREIHFEMVKRMLETAINDDLGHILTPAHQAVSLPLNANTAVSEQPDPVNQDTAELASSPPSPQAVALKTLGFKKVDLLITELMENKRYKYKRKEASPDLVVFVLYGQGEHFKGGRHEIGRIFLTPESFKVNLHYSFTTPQEDVRGRFTARGEAPALVNDPELFPYGIPSEAELLPPNVILAQRKQFENFAHALGDMLMQAIQSHRDTAVTATPTPTAPVYNITIQGNVVGGVIGGGTVNAQNIAGRDITVQDTAVTNPPDAQE